MTEEPKTQEQLEAEAIADLESRKRSYQLTFQKEQPANQEVLKDLAIFCRAQESCAIPGDHDRTMLLLGRQEVWLRITEWLGLTPTELFILKGGPIRREMKHD